jgi:hypothetical protein
MLQIQYLIGINKSTIEGYIQSILDAGHAYRWETFGVEDYVFEKVKKCVKKLQNKSNQSDNDEDEGDKENMDMNADIVKNGKKPTQRLYWPAAKDVKKVLNDDTIEYGHIKWSVLHLKELHRRGMYV